MNPRSKTINIIFMNGGVGDHMASLVATNYIIEKYDWITPLIWVPDLLKDFSKNVLPEGTQVFSYTEMKGRYEPKKPTKTTAWDGVVSPMKIHSLDYAFLKLCDENPPLSKKNYLSIVPKMIDISRFDVLLPRKFVVVTTGFTADVREFRAKEVNALVDFIRSQDHEVVFLGDALGKTGALYDIKTSFNGEINFKSGVDLRGQTSLLEAAKIMSWATAVVGVDNGLLHVAGCTDVPIVAGYTTVHPRIRMPVRRDKLGWNCFPIAPLASLDCRFCQQETNFLYGHDYRKCLFSNEKGQEHRVNLCTEQMTAERFIDVLKVFL